MSRVSSKAKNRKLQKGKNSQLSSAASATSGFLARLAGGNRRSLGHANKVATTITKNPRMFPALIAGMRSTDPLVRAADAVEKITRGKRNLLQPHKRELLGVNG